MIMLNILSAAIQNLVTHATRCPRLVTPCFKQLCPMLGLVNNELTTQWREGSLHALNCCSVPAYLEGLTKPRKTCCYQAMPAEYDGMMECCSSQPRLQVTVCKYSSMVS